MHVVYEWIGNSRAAAAKHCLQATDEHFNRAVREAVQNPVQQTRKTTCTGPQENTATPGFSEDFQGLQACTRFRWAI